MTSPAACYLRRLGLPDRAILRTLALWRVLAPSDAVHGSECRPEDVARLWVALGVCR